MFEFGVLIWWFGLVGYLLLVGFLGLLLVYFVALTLRISLIVLVRCRVFVCPSYCLVCLLIVLGLWLTGECGFCLGCCDWRCFGCLLAGWVFWGLCCFLILVAAWCLVFERWFLWCLRVAAWCLVFEWWFLGIWLCAWDLWFAVISGGFWFPFSLLVLVVGWFCF